MSHTARGSPPAHAGNTYLGRPLFLLSFFYFNQRTPFRSFFTDVIRRQFRLCPVFIIFRLADVHKCTFCLIEARTLVTTRGHIHINLNHSCSPFIFAPQFWQNSINPIITSLTFSLTQHVPCKVRIKPYLKTQVTALYGLCL